MAHSFVKNHLHVIFSTKERHKLISKEMQPRLWAYMAGICRNHGMFVGEIGGTEDHIHALIELPSVLAPAKAVLLIKSNSSKWMNEQGIKFRWQEGHGAFSVSASNLAAVVKYIRNQENHHRKRSFEQEYLTFLRKHNVDFDPQYVFD